MDILLDSIKDDNNIVLNDRDIREEIDTFMFEVNYWSFIIYMLHTSICG